MLMSHCQTSNFWSGLVSVNNLTIWGQPNHEILSYNVQISNGIKNLVLSNNYLYNNNTTPYTFWHDNLDSIRRNWGLKEGYIRRVVKRWNRARSLVETLTLIKVWDILDGIYLTFIDQMGLIPLFSLN